MYIHFVQRIENGENNSFSLSRPSKWKLFLWKCCDSFQTRCVGRLVKCRARFISRVREKAPRQFFHKKFSPLSLSSGIEVNSRVFERRFFLSGKFLIRIISRRCYLECRLLSTQPLKVASERASLRTWEKFIYLFKLIIHLLNLFEEESKDKNIVKIEKQKFGIRGNFYFYIKKKKERII